MASNADLAEKDHLWMGTHHIILYPELSDVYLALHRSLAD